MNSKLEFTKSLECNGYIQTESGSQWGKYADARSLTKRIKDFSFHQRNRPAELKSPEDAGSRATDIFVLLSISATIATIVTRLQVAERRALFGLNR